MWPVSTAVALVIGVVKQSPLGTMAMGPVKSPVAVVTPPMVTAV